MRRYAVSDTRCAMADQPLTLVNSHDDDSDESHNPFDDRVEQAQKELMWAQLQRRYMNVWEYTSRRWNAADILTVLRLSLIHI